MTELKIKESAKTIIVQNVYCIGRNYPEHIKEMNYPEIPELPVIFLKPTTAIATNPGTIAIPEFNGKKISDNLQNELELVFVIGKDGKNIPLDKADEYIFGYCVGIDFTLRDLQGIAKQKGLPWGTSKGFFGSGPVSEIVPKRRLGSPDNLDMKLYINGEYKQGGNTSQMIFNVNFLSHYISSVFGLKKGDLIFTGTPAGVHRLQPGDIIEGEIESVGNLRIEVL
jgi:2-keto-4-pentenoate hydratase/2-oxohepta-3-ene-1,7-dioic acid hydratase in catechol pathway